MAPWPEEVSAGLRSSKELDIVFRSKTPWALKWVAGKTTGSLHSRELKAGPLWTLNAHSSGRTVISSSVTKASNEHGKGKGPIRREVRHHIGYNHYPQQKSDVQPVLALRCRMPK